MALAALVARRPALWLLDEPHAGLDAGARDLLAALVAETAAAGAAVLLSSHEPDLAVPMADRVVVMSGGRVGRGASGRSRPPTLRAVPTGDAHVA